MRSADKEAASKVVNHFVASHDEVRSREKITFDSSVSDNNVGEQQSFNKTHSSSSRRRKVVRRKCYWHSR